MSRKTSVMLITLTVAVTIATAAAQQNIEQMYREKWEGRERLYSSGKIKEATLILEELLSIEEFQEMEQERIGVLYNLACGYSLMGDTSKALTYLAEVIDAGYNNYDHLQKDGDLDNLRGTEQFKRLLHQVESRSQFWDNSFIGAEYRENISADEKVAGLSKLWSEVKFNFVYFDRVPDLNWDSLYLAYLPKVTQTNTTLEYYRTLQKMCAHLNDGHTSITPPPELYDELWADMPMSTRLVEGKVLVKSVDSDSLVQRGIKPGLEITHINDIPVNEYVRDSVMPYLSVSTEQARIKQAYGSYLLAGSVNNPVKLTFIDADSHSFSATLSRWSWRQLPNNSPDISFKILEGNIAYVEITTFGNDSIVKVFDSLFEEVEQTEALIIDVRRNGGGNSGVGWQILAYLADSSFACLQCKMRTYYPQRRLDGLMDSWDVSDWKHPANPSKHFSRPVVILIGPSTGSAAEDFVVPFDFMKRGKLIGEPTAGSTGQPLLFSLPGGGQGRVCTKRCTYPDGKEFVGFGIQPDIFVRPKVEDILFDRDAVLEAAMAYLKDVLGK